MSFKRTLFENRRSGRMGAIWAVLLGLAVSTTAPSLWLNARSYDLLLAFRPKQKIDEAVIIYMDEASRDLLHQDPNMEWNRTNHVQLLKTLAGAKPKAIIFDVLLDLPSRGDVDKALGEAMRLHAKVVLAGRVERSLAGNVPTIKSQHPLSVFGSNNWGVANFPPSKDATLRWHSFDEEYPSLAWKLAEMLNKVREDPSRLRWINYYGPSGLTIPSKSYYQALEAGVPARAVFADKLVFVGKAPIPDSQGTQGDTLRTPLGIFPGVEIQATACLNMVRGDWLEQLPTWAEFLLLLLVGTFFGFGLTLVRPWTALGLSIAGFSVLAGVDLFLFWQKHLWFSWLTIGIQIFSALVWAVFADFKKADRENEFLADALAKVKSGIPMPTAPTLPPRTRPIGASATETPGVIAAVGSSSTDYSGGGELGATVVDEPAARVLADHELVRCVGKGAYGEVWLGRDVIGAYHALKIIHRKTFSSDAPYEREFHGIQKFTPISRSHPGFVHILHVGRNDPEGFFYYVMEVADDEYSGQAIDPKTYSPNNLYKEIERRGKIPVKKCLQASLELTAALGFLHQNGLIHRDIKPANIIFVNGAAKIADIGLVTAIPERGRDATYIGTEGYIPPEGPGTTAADVYSLGKVIYEASMGRDKERYPTFPTTLAERPDKDELLLLNEIICKACEADIRRRYQSAAELHADLLRLQERIGG